MFQASTIDAVLVACGTAALGRYGGGDVHYYCDMACMQLQ
jgi:hypothetical protein